jgi:predicted transcriptional regulator
MNEENFILVSLEDSKSKEISEILGSKTCKKIIGYLSENKEASQKDLSDNLNIPMNTLDYNIKKLLSSGFVQKRKNFFWSKKGKKIVMYEISNKSIVISPKKSASEKIKSIIPAFILTIAGTFAVAVYEKISVPGIDAPREIVADSVQESVMSLATKTGSTEGIFSYLLTPHPFPLWGWFLTGALLAIIILSIVNWRKL